MAIEIPNSAVAVCGVDLTVMNAGFWSTADTAITAIGQELIGDGLTISQKSVGLSGITFPITGEFSATLQILNQSGQELDDTDLQSQFNDACNEASIQVNSFGVQQVIIPSGGGDGVNSGTGTAGGPQVITTGAGVAAASSGSGTPTPACGDPALTFIKYPEAWLSCLTNKALSTIGLLGIGLLVGVILIVMVQRRPGPA